MNINNPFPSFRNSPSHFSLWILEAWSPCEQIITINPALNLRGWVAHNTYYLYNQTNSVHRFEENNFGAINKPQFVSASSAVGLVVKGVYMAVENCVSVVQGNLEQGSAWHACISFFFCLCIRMWSLRLSPEGLHLLLPPAVPKY